MELDQFNKGIIWPVVPCNWTLLYSLSSGIQSQTPWSQKQCPLMSTSMICRCPVEPWRSRVGSVQCVPGSAASCSGSGCLQTLQPTTRGSRHISALLVLTTQVPAIAANHTVGTSQHHTRNPKFENNWDTVDFSTLNWTVLVCNF